MRVVKSRKLKWADYVAGMEEGRDAFKIFPGKTSGKIPIGRPRRRWEDSIRMDVKDIGVNTRSWIPPKLGLAIVNAELNFWVSEATELVSIFIDIKKVSA